MIWKAIPCTDRNWRVLRTDKLWENFRFFSENPISSPPKRATWEPKRFALFKSLARLSTLPIQSHVSLSSQPSIHQLFITCARSIGIQSNWLLSSSWDIRLNSLNSVTECKFIEIRALCGSDSRSEIYLKRSAFLLCTLYRQIFRFFLFIILKKDIPKVFDIFKAFSIPKPFQMPSILNGKGKFLDAAVCILNWHF